MCVCVTSWGVIKSPIMVDSVRFDVIGNKWTLTLFHCSFDDDDDDGDGGGGGGGDRSFFRSFIGSFAFLKKGAHSFNSFTSFLWESFFFCRHRVCLVAISRQDDQDERGSYKPL